MPILLFASLLLFHFLSMSPAAMTHFLREAIFCSRLFLFFFSFFWHYYYHGQLHYPTNTTLN